MNSTKIDEDELSKRFYEAQAQQVESCEYSMNFHNITSLKFFIFLMRVYFSDIIWWEDVAVEQSGKRVPMF